MTDYKKHSFLIEIEETIDAYIVMRELTENAIRSKFRKSPLNVLHDLYYFRNYLGTTLNIKAFAASKKARFTIHESNMVINTSRVDSLKKWKRNVVVEGKQGKRQIEIWVNNAEEVQQLLQDLDNWL